MGAQKTCAGDALFFLALHDRPDDGKIFPHGVDGAGVGGSEDGADTGLGQTQQPRFHALY